MHHNYLSNAMKGILFIIINYRMLSNPRGVFGRLCIYFGLNLNVWLTRGQNQGGGGGLIVFLKYYVVVSHQRLSVSFSIIATNDLYLQRSRK